jgi:hypothetical protein
VIISTPGVDAVATDVARLGTHMLDSSDGRDTDVFAEAFDECN